MFKILKNSAIIEIPAKNSSPSLTSAKAYLAVNSFTSGVDRRKIFCSSRVALPLLSFENHSAVRRKKSIFPREVTSISASTLIYIGS